MGYDPAMRKTTSALGSVVVILTMLAVLVCLLMLGSRAFGTNNYDLLILPSLAGFIGLINSFRMIREPDPAPSGSAEGTVLG